MDGEPLLGEGTADHDRCDPTRRQCANVVEVADATAGVERDAIADNGSDRIDQAEGWTSEPAFRGEIDQVERAYSGELRCARRGKRAAPDGDRDEIGLAAARCEEPGASLDLDDARVAKRGDPFQEIVIAEHGAREEDARESTIDRPPRLVHARDAARETAWHTRGARDLSEEVEILRCAGLRAIQVDEVQLLGALGDQVAGSRDDGLTYPVGRW